MKKVIKKPKKELALFNSYYDFCLHMIELDKECPGIIWEDKIQEYKDYIKNNEKPL